MLLLHYNLFIISGVYCHSNLDGRLIRHDMRLECTSLSFIYRLKLSMAIHLETVPSQKELRESDYAT